MKSTTTIFVSLTCAYFSPIVTALPVIIGGAAATAVGAGSIFGAYKGHMDGKILGYMPDAYGNARSEEEKRKLMRAGAAKGAIDGALAIPNVILGPVTHLAGNKAAADILEIEDMGKVMRASAAAGAPILTIDPQYKAYMASNILDVPNHERTSDLAAVLHSGELDALAQFKDKEAKTEKESKK